MRGRGRELAVGGPGGASASAPAAPTLTLISGAGDNTPDFLVEADTSDLPVAATVTVYAYTDEGLTTLEDSGTGTVTVAGSVTITDQIGPLTDGDKWYIAKTSIAAHSISAASNTESNTIDSTAPTITSSSTDSVAENSTLSHSLAANETVTWSIVGGSDQAKFEISGSTLRWAGNGTKDYEVPDDANTDNAYVVQIRATDVVGNTTNQTITITVTDVSEATGSVWTVTDPAVTLSNGNLDASDNDATLAYQYATISTTKTSGKWHIEQKIVALHSSGAFIQFVITLDAAVNGYAIEKPQGSGSGTSGNGITYHNTASYGTLVANDVIAWEIDVDAGNAWISVNGTFGGSQDPVSGADPDFTWTPSGQAVAVQVGLFGAVGNQTVRLQPAGSQSYPPSTGFTAWA